MTTNSTLHKRFWKYVDVRDASECWVWSGAKRRRGYGMIREGGKGSKNLVASRLSYEIHHGKIPYNMVVMHSCDNPSCVNPEHLLLGTHKDNTHDAMKKRRMRGLFKKGFDQRRHRPRKLTENDVKMIRASKKTSTVLAIELGVSLSTVCKARNKTTWGHL